MSVITIWIKLNCIFSSFKFFISVIMKLKDKTLQLTASSCSNKPAFHHWLVEFSYWDGVPDSWLWRWSHVPSSAVREWWEGMIYRDKGSRDSKQEKETEWEWKAEWSGQTARRNAALFSDQLLTYAAFQSTLLIWLAVKWREPDTLPSQSPHSFTGQICDGLALAK